MLAYPIRRESTKLQDFWSAEIKHCRSEFTAAEKQLTIKTCYFADLEGFRFSFITFNDDDKNMDLSSDDNDEGCLAMIYSITRKKKKKKIDKRDKGDTNFFKLHFKYNSCVNYMCYATNFSHIKFKRLFKKKEF